jgi:hypothetical protein
MIFYDILNPQSFDGVCHVSQKLKITFHNVIEIIVVFFFLVKHRIATLKRRFVIYSVFFLSPSFKIHSTHSKFQRYPLIYWHFHFCPYYFDF